MVGLENLRYFLRDIHHWFPHEKIATVRLGGMMKTAYK
jgi:hypothetical protein